MRTSFRSSFLRDLKKVRDQAVLDRVRAVIEEAEAAEDLSAVSRIKKIKGAGDYYRIRVGDYRIGVVVSGSTIEFVRCLHRREIYRRFP